MLCSILLAGLLHAQAAEAPYISVGQARVKKTVIAFPEVKVSGTLASGLGKQIAETVTDDLTFMDFFTFLGKSAFIEDSSKAGITPGSFKVTDWSSVGAEILLKTALTQDGPNLALEVHLYEAATGKELLAKRLKALPSEVKIMSHTLANFVVEALTGLPGIFLTKIAMSCDRTGKKEIYVMNFDGTDVKQITHHNSIAFAPAWSPDSRKLAYSLYTKNKANIKNIDLYEYSFATNVIKMLSNRRGINSGAAYAPDGKRMALTMSYLGNPEIFLFEPESKAVTRLTKSLGFDVDPSWSPDGKKMAFVSNRTGMPMVFSMNADGSDAKRLTFAGRYNATPSWSPKGSKLVFAGWIDKIFDIFLMNSDGTNIERLTKEQGNNEDPYFSADGNFVVFSSNRTGQKNIYVMNIDGTFVKRLTFGLGNCVAPKWSNPPPAPAPAPASVAEPAPEEEKPTTQKAASEE